MQASLCLHMTWNTTSLVGSGQHQHGGIMRFSVSDAFECYPGRWTCDNFPLNKKGLGRVDFFV